MASDTPRKVNAAQLAARKIKAPVRRNKPAPSHPDGNQVPLFAPMPTLSFGPSSGGNPFGTANNSFNFAAPIQTNFGSSVAFPNATPTPSISEDPRADTTGEEAARRGKPFQMFGSGTASPAPQQQGGMFGQNNTGFGNSSSNLFGSASQPPSQTSSFSFGATNNQNQPASNPFQFSQNAQQPPSSSVFNFNASASQAAPVNNPFQFSAQQPGTPSTSFGSTVQAEKPAPFSFGASQPAAPSSNIFGGFNAGTPAEKPATPSFSFGQTQSQGGSQPGSQPSSRPASPAVFNFGKASTPVPAPAQEKPASSVFSFGQTAQGQPSTTPAPATTNMFGQVNATAAAPSNPFGQSTQAATASNLFGQSSKPVAAPSSNLFGQTSQQTPAPVTGLFGQQPANPFANIKVPDAAPSPASSTNFFGSQTSRSVSPEKNMTGTDNVSGTSLNLFGASTAQPSVPSNQFASQKIQSTNNLFGKPAQDVASPAKGIFGNLPGVPSPSKTTFGGEQNEGPRESLFVPQTPKPTGATDLFGKPKAAEIPSVSEKETPKPTVNLFAKSSATPPAHVFADAAQKTPAPINIFAQSTRSSESNTDSNIQESTNTVSALSEISNGAKTPSRNAPAKLSEVNSATKLNAPQPQLQPESPSRTILDSTSVSSDLTTATTLLHPNKTEEEMSSFKEIILERAEEYDETETFSKAYSNHIAKVIAKYFPTTLSARQQLEAYAAIQIRCLKRQAELTLRSELRPEKRAKLIELARDKEIEVERWGELQARKVEKRKADSLDDSESSDQGSNKRQKPSETPKDRAQKAPAYASPVKAILDKVRNQSSYDSDLRSSLTKPQPISNGTTTPKGPVPEKNLFLPPATAQAAPSPSPKGKRKADVQLTKDDPSGEGSESPSSQIKLNGVSASATSNLFRNLVGNSPQTAATTPTKPMFSLTKTADQSEKPRANPFASLALPGSASPAKLNAPALATPSKNVTPANPFQLKSATPAASAETPKPNPFQLKTATSTAPSAPAAGGFVFKPSQSTGASAQADFMAQFAQAAKKTEDKAMQNAKDEDWDEDDETEAEWEARYKKEQAEKKKALEEKLKTKPAMAIPKFGQAPGTPAKDQSETKEQYVSQFTGFSCPNTQGKITSSSTAEKSQQMTDAKPHDFSQLFHDERQTAASSEAAVERQQPQSKRLQGTSQGHREEVVSQESTTVEVSAHDDLPDYEEDSPKTVQNMTPLAQHGALGGHSIQGSSLLSQPSTQARPVATLGRCTVQPAPVAQQQPVIFTPMSTFGQSSRGRSGLFSLKSQPTQNFFTPQPPRVPSFFPTASPAQSVFAQYTNNNTSSRSFNIDESETSSPSSVLNDYVPGSGKIGGNHANPFAHLSDVESRASSGKGNEADDDSDGKLTEDEPATQKPKAGGDLFSRISRDPKATSTSTSVFGSGMGSPADKTWQHDSPIKFAASSSSTSNIFGSPSNAPTPAPMLGSHAVSPAPASKGPFAGLFGTKTSTEILSTPSAPKFTGFNFGGSPVDSARQSGTSTPVPAAKSTPFSFLTDVKASLAPPSSSLGTSRATTPGVTTEAESNAGEAATSGDAEEAGEQLPQMKDIASADEPGEETLFLQKANAKVFKDGAWATGLVGMLKLLKNTETGRIRYLMRLDNGKPVINKSFLPVDPQVAKKAVVVMMPADPDAPEGAPPIDKWHITVRTPELAKEFAEIIKKCKPT